MQGMTILVLPSVDVFKVIDQICIGKPPPEPDREQALDEGSADSESEGEDEGFDERCAQETDAERLKMMRDLMGGEDLGVLRDEYEDDVVLVSDISGTFADSSEMRFGKGKDDERQVASSSSAVRLHSG